MSEIPQNTPEYLTPNPEDDNSYPDPLPPADDETFTRRIERLSLTQSEHNELIEQDPVDFESEYPYAEEEIPLTDTDLPINNRGELIVNTALNIVVTGLMTGVGVNATRLIGIDYAPTQVLLATIWGGIATTYLEHFNDRLNNKTPSLPLTIQRLIFNTINSFFYTLPGNAVLVSFIGAALKTGLLENQKDNLTKTKSTPRLKNKLTHNLEMVEIEPYYEAEEPREKSKRR